MSGSQAQSRGGWYLPLVLVLIGATYWSGLGNGFVWLDQSEILEEVLIVDEWSEVLGLFSNDRNNPGYHRPIYTLMHSLDKALWGTNPFGFLLSSLLLHLANVSLVFLILRQLARGALPAALIALFWGLHPVNSAVVGLIHSKADLLFLFGALGSIWFFLRTTAEPRRSSWSASWLLSGLAFLLALLSKENAVVFAVLLAVLAARPGLWAGEEFPARTRTALRRYAGIAVGLTLVVFAMRLGSTPPGSYVSELALSERLQTFAGVYLGYLRKLFLPLELSICDTVTAYSALSGEVQARTMTTLAVVLGLQLWAAARYPWLRIWLVLFNLSLAPVAQLVPILHFRADRFLYLPSLAFVGAIVEGTARALRKPDASARAKLVAAAIAVLCLAFSSGRIHLRLRDFKNDQALFKPELERTPDYLEGLSVLGRSYDRAGNHELAGELLRLSLADYPGRISYLDRGGAALAYSYNLLARGEVEEAREFLESAKQLAVKAVHREELDYNLAVAEFRVGDYESAFDGFASYNARHPEDPSCLYFLGRSAMLLQREELARKALRDYLRLAPSAPDRAVVEGWLRELDD